MAPTRSRSPTCRLCGRAVAGDPATDGDGTAFCSTGCRDVHATLGGGDADDDSGPPRDDSASGDGGPTEADEEADAIERVFLRVEGTHSVTCEAFLEAVAERREGVAAAEASYVTGTVRIEYDPDRVTPAALRDALSTLGYSASLPDDEDGADGPAGGRDSSGTGSGGMTEMLGFRYAAGVVFASFMLLPYVVLWYPAHLAALVDSAALASFAGRIQTGGGSGLLMLPLFLVMTGVVLFFTGAPLLRGAYVSVKMRRPNTDLLVSLTLVGAYLYSTGAVLVGRTDVFFDLTMVVAATVVAASFYEALVKRRAMDRLTDLTVSQVTEARRYDPDGSTTTVAVDDLDPGDRVLVRRGERVPVDGVLAEGDCTVDEAVVTGESLPVVKRAGDAVVGGSVVTADAAVVEVGEGATSGIDRLVRSVRQLQSATHGVQRRANRLAARLVPALLGAAALAGLAHLALGSGLPAALLTALVVLLAASPWALGLATPLSVAASIEAALERGVVVFDETVFERLRAVDVVVFDKTGTLTTGEMDVVAAEAPPESLSAAAALERRAAHPAAAAIVDAFGGDGDGSAPRTDGGADAAGEAGSEGEADHADPVEEFTAHATGVEGLVDGTRVLVGHPDLFAERGWSVGDAVRERVATARERGRLPVVVGREGRAEGVVAVGDRPRDGWAATVERLADRGVEVVVLTGDDRDAAEPYADHPDVTHAFVGVPPDGKTATIRRLQSAGTVAMVGDGTNDAPALAAADLGVALGSGTALASDAADVAIVDDDLAAVETAFDLAAAARRRVGQNNALALLYNVAAIPLAAVGLLNPLLAMVAVVVTGGLVAGNSFRALLDE